MQTDYAAQYRELWERHWWWRARERFVLRWLERTAPPPGGRVLNIGCGEGLLMPALARFGEVDGVEPDRSLVPEHCSHRDRIDIRAFGADYPTEHRYRLLVMLDVLEHIEDDVAALRRAREIVEPGGVLFMTVPALPSLWSQHDVVNAHFRRYTRSRLREVIEASGWKISVLRYFFTWTVAPLYLRSILFPARRDGNGDASSYRPRVPPTVINAPLLALSTVEQAVLEALPPPTGSSLLAVATVGGAAA